MSDKNRDEFTERIKSEEKNMCGAVCPNCIGGTCFLETGHASLHHCSSCGNTWETLHHFSSDAGL
jgi:hypothetical protein